MAHESHWFRRETEALLLFLAVQPKSSSDQLVGIHAGRLKIRITAPPVDGKANQHLIKYLAKLFHVRKSQIRIEKGQTGKHKQVRINTVHDLPAAFDFIDEAGGVRDEP